MSVFLSPVGGAGAQFFDNNGNPLTGGKLYTYAAGTTTPVVTYTSSAGNTAHSNPIVLDAGGRVPGSSEIWLTDSVSYKFVLKDSNDVLLATWDNITGINSNFVNFTAQEEVITATAGQTVFTLTSITYTPGSNNLQVFVDGVNQIVDDSYLETNSTTVTFVSGLHVGALVKFTTAVSNSSGIETDAALVTYDPPFTGSESTTVEDKLAQTVSVKDFGAVGDGVTDDTAAFVTANTASLALVLPMNGVYNLTNWVPLAGTTIIAHGATIQRGATTTYGATGSSAAIVIANDGVEIFGGKITDKSGLTQATFSGGVLVDGGDNFTMHGVEATGLWSSVFGNSGQNGSNLANDVTLDSCWLHDNQHNTYFADIDGLIVNGCVLERANRDGMKTYRNVKNITITGNIIRDNGDGTVGQSMDGLDLFIAGNTVIISGNLIYNNDAKGIDFKRNAFGSTETLQNQKIIITGNHIYGHGGEGIQCEVVDGVGYVENASVFGNHIYGNGGRGIYFTFAKGADISHNNIYGNTIDGIRLDNVDGVRVVGNYITDNTTNGINCVSGTRVYVTTNQVRGTANQTNGILMGAALTASICRDNDSTGHSGVNYQAAGTAYNVQGKTLSAPITNTTGSQFIGFAPKGSTSGVEVMLNNTATMDFTLSKYSESTGAFVGNISASAGLSFPTARVAVSPAVTGSNTVRNLAGNNAIYVTLANITSSFVTGYVNLHYID